MQVQTAAADDGSRIVAAILLAFSTDPAARWTYPSPENYLRHFAEIIPAFGRRALECGTAHFIGDAGGGDVHAVSLWLPPEVQLDEDALLDIFRRTVPKPNQEALFAVFEQMGTYHPDEPHWFLPLIAVDPMHQRKGYGSMLLEHALQGCDRDRKPAYLESSNPENIPLYQRHGFEILGTIQVGTSPPITPMLRVPR
jgi:GNAT superfamily N-acetyltransferase